MTAAAERIREEVSKLPGDERQALVRMLELDLDSALSEDEIDAAWDDVVEERAAAVQAGRTPLIPLAQVEAEIDAFVAGLAKA